MLEQLGQELHARPYRTLVGLVGVGFMLGRAVSVRALVDVAKVGARAAVAMALERTLRDLIGPEGTRR